MIQKVKQKFTKNNFIKVLVLSTIISTVISYLALDTVESYVSEDSNNYLRDLGTVYYELEWFIDNEQKILNKEIDEFSVQMIYESMISARDARITDKLEISGEFDFYKFIKYHTGMTVATFVENYHKKQISEEDFNGLRDLYEGLHAYLEPVIKKDWGTEEFTTEDYTQTIQKGLDNFNKMRTEQLNGESK